MKRLLLGAAVVFSGWITAIAQNGSIEGMVSQVDSTTALLAVSVYLDKTDIGAFSNGNGYYSIENIAAGNYTVVASAIGYFTLKKEISIKAEEKLTVDFIMVETISMLSEITVTGGKIGVRDIPGSVHYLPPEELKKFNYTDINRTLRAVPGVNIQEEDGFGLFPSIGLRGTGVERNTKITVMEDGVLMAPAPYAAPAAYYFPSMGRIQGVEIIKGSSQIKYGPYTTGGAINLISTQIPSEFSGKISLSAGTFKGRNLHAVVGNTHRNFAYMLETFQFSSDGFKQLDGAEDRGFDRNIGFIKQDYLAKFRLFTDDSAKIVQSLLFKIGQSTGDINETYLGLSQEDFEANPIRRYAASQTDNIQSLQNQLSLNHHIEFSPSFEITTVVYRTTFSRNWYKLDSVKDSMGVQTKIGAILDNPTQYSSAYDIITGAGNMADNTLFVKANNRKYYSQGLQTKLSAHFKGHKIKHNIDLGIRLHQDQVDRFQWVDEYVMDKGVMALSQAGIHGTESNRVETVDALAVYLQYKLKIGDFTITPGIRNENISWERLDYGKNNPERNASDSLQRNNTVSVFIPGIGLDYRHNKYLNIFMGIHKGFAPPGSKEGLEAEESINYELGTRYTRKGLSGQAVVFFNDYTNLLGTDLEAAGGGSTNEQFNAGAVQTKGLEFNLTYDLFSSKKKSTLSLPLSIVYTYTDARFLNNFESDFGGWGDVTAGDQFPYLANNQLTLMLGLDYHQFSFNLSGKYMDEMRTMPGQGNIPVNEKTDAYFVVDAGANYTIQKGISIFATVTNLTRQVYVVARRPAGLRPGMPRALNVGLRADF